MTAIKNLVTREPVLISGLVEAVIVCAVAFGANLTTEQTAAILSLVAVATAIVARMFVTPTSTV